MQLKNDITVTKSYMLKEEVLRRIKNNNTFISIALITVFGLLLRFIFIEDAGGDYDGFLSQWCMYLRENGGFNAIASVDTDYNVSYLYFLALFSYLPVKDLYLIKFLSFIFDFVMALAGFFIVSYFEKENEKKILYSLAVFAGILFMPTVILNSASWVQCDSIYTSFILLSLYFMLKEKYDLSFILYGVAITFKLQAVFILPAYGIIFLKNRNFSFLKFLWVPVVKFILYMPAVILGKPLSSLYDAYITQTGRYAYKTTLGYPNLYYFFGIYEIQLIKPGIIFTMCLLFVLMIFVLLSKNKLSNKEIIHLGVAVIFLVTFFLPEMHDRYGYVAEVLFIIYFAIVKRDWIILLIININALITYLSFLEGVPEEVMPVVAVYQFIVVIYFVATFIIGRIKGDAKKVIVKGEAF